MANKTKTRKTKTRFSKATLAAYLMSRIQQLDDAYNFEPYGQSGQSQLNPGDGAVSFDEKWILIDRSVGYGFREAFHEIIEKCGLA